ncbi:MAG: GyrI-like domain-containing protein [Bacteroidota bacterium]
MEQVTIKPFKLIGLSIRTSNSNGQAAQEIGALWNTFLGTQIPQQIPNKLSEEVYSLYTDYDGDHTQPYTVVLGCPVENLDNIPEGLVGRTFEGGNYVRLSAKGALADGIVVNKWMEIWEAEKQGKLNRAYTADFEVFGAKAQNPSDAEVDFLIAIHT